uniref:Uncharacterized protein n=1 Tax=Cajanus cajan TaxID=3821 RepID=A0A151UEW8_CAJCA
MKTYFTFQDLWDTIEEGFPTPEDTSSLTVANSTCNFELLNMKESETVKDYYSKIKEIVNQMPVIHILTNLNFLNLIIPYFYFQGSLIIN